MDACNLPELLALDLETAELIFAAKRMTAGAPRPSTPRSALNTASQNKSNTEAHTPPRSHTFNFAQSYSHARPRPAAHAEPRTMSPEGEGRFQPRPVSPFSREDALSRIRVTDFVSLGSGAARPVVILGESENYSSFSPSYPTITSDGDNASVDSFEIPNISLVSPRCVRSEQQYRQQQHRRKQLQRGQAAQDLYLHSGCYSDSRAPGNISPQSRDSIFGNEGADGGNNTAENEGGDGGNVDADDDGYNMPSDTSSVSSLGFANSSVHDCRRSVVTAATSVASASRSSAQSHTLSAIGPASPKLQYLGEYVPTAERHVDFRLAGNIAEMDGNNGDKSFLDVMVDDTMENGGKHDRSNTRPQSRYLQQSSWMNFGDDEESDEETQPSQPLSNKLASRTDEIHLISRPSSEASRISRPYSPLSRRPNSAMSWFGKGKDQSNRLHDWTEKKRMSQTSVTSIPSLRRRSSLSSYRTAAPPSDRPAILLPLQYLPPDRQNPRQQRQSCQWRSHLSISSAVSAPPSAREVERMHALIGMQNSSSFSGEQTEFSAPVSLGQFDGTESYGNEDGEECDGADLFTDSDGDDFDHEEDEIMTATVVPLSKQLPSAVSARRGSMDEAAVALASPSFPFSNTYHTPAFDAEETSLGLQSWIQQTFVTQEEVVPRLLRGQDGIFRFESRARIAHEQEEEEFQTHDACRHDESRPLEQRDAHNVLEPAAQQKQAAFPLVFQPTAPMVAVRLPKEVVDMLRVSVSCFPETMLSLSSFCIQTIRSYSRKVRRLSEFDGDTANWLLPSSSSCSTLPPSPTGGVPFVPAPMCRSPMAPSMQSGPAQDWPASSGSSTRAGSIAASSQRSARRFWMLPKRLVSSRTTPNASSLESTPGTACAQRRSHSRSNRGGEDVVEVDQDKVNGACFKRIFPTGSDYMCDALYAHILAFNYISLLCSQEFAPAQLSESSPTGAVKASGSNYAPSVVGSGLMEPMQTPKRQTIRVYAGTDVNVPPPSSPLRQRGGEAFLDETGGDMPSSPPDTPPPSRGGRPDEDVRLISRKAAIILGIQEHLEPETGRRSSEASGSITSVGSGVAGLGRRYNSLRRRRRKTVGGDGGEADKANKSRGLVKKTRPPPLPPTALFDMGRSTLYEDQQQGQTKDVAVCLPLTPPPSAAAVAAAAASETAMRDLQAGLYGCIRQLVSTLKLTTGRLGDSTLRHTGVREVDQVFLRTLCELVRSQEEQV